MQIYGYDILIINQRQHTHRRSELDAALASEYLWGGLASMVVLQPSHFLTHAASCRS